MHLAVWAAAADLVTPRLLRRAERISAVAGTVAAGVDMAEADTAARAVAAIITDPGKN